MNMQTPGSSHANNNLVAKQQHMNNIMQQINFASNFASNFAKNLQLKNNLKKPLLSK